MKGSEEPNTPEPLPRVFWAGGKAVLFVPVACPKGLPEGLPPPKMLEPPAFSDPREPNPPLLANPAKPEDDGAAAGVAEAPPNGLCLEPEPRLANPDCPKDGAAADVAPVAQGEALTPAFEERPKPDGFPNAGAEEAGEPPKELEPNVGPPVVGAAAGAEGVPHGEALEPKADEPPNAGAAAGEPNADPAAGAGLLKAEVGVATCAGACAEESAATIPEYVVPLLIEGAYMTHQEQRIPSCVSTQYAGTGPGDSSISSVGIGLYTVSFEDKSSAQPTGIAF